jgi:tetratricopeptide (TPR) repeat protein
MDVFKTVHDWLSDEANGKWVMILDNADDIDVFKAPPPRYNAHSETIAPSKTELRQFLPKSSTGSILITTVTTHVARELVDNANHYLNVELMNEDEALLLLERKLRGNHNTDEMRELIKTLEYLPIAISQAAAFISKSEPRETVAGYIAKAKSSDVTKLLEESIYESHRDADRSNSVVVSWQITFRYILRKRPSAARLLSLMCLFDRQQILDPFLIGLYGKKDSALIPVAVPPMNRLKKRLYDRDYKRRYEKESGRRAENEHEFGKDWQVLHDFLLIKTDAKGNSFSMHRLVQVTARRWLEHNEEMQHWTRRYMYIVDYVFKFTITIEGDTNTSFFWPHLRQLEDYQPDDNWELTTWVRMMKLAAEIGIHYDGAHAEVLSKAVFNVVKSTLGMENEMTLGYANIVVKALHHLHKFEEAEPLAREVFQKYVKILGPDHESTVGSMHNLASLLWSQGEANQEKEAEGCALMSRVAEARQGKDNVWVLMHLSETTYADMRGRYLMSEGRIRALYPVGNRVAGSWDSIAILLTTSLAANYMAQERFAESEELYRQALREQGKDGYMDVVQSLALASVFARQEKVEEAEDLYRRVSEYISKGDYWEDELVLKAELAAVLVKRGAFREAEELSHQVLQRTLHKVVPANHEPWVAMHTLAAIREQQGHYEEALARYNVAHAGMLVTQRDFYLDTKAYLKDYSALKSKLEGEEPSGQDSAPDYQDLSNESEAFYQMQALPKFEWKCGFEYGPTLATAIGSLAQTLSMRGCFQEANYTICLALEGLMGMLGPEHQDTLQCFRAWAEILVRQNMFGDALVAYKFWYAGLGKTLGEEHGDTQRALHSLTEVQEKIEAGSAPARDVGSLLSGEKTYFPGQWVD